MSKRLLDIRYESGDPEGVVEIDVDGFVRIHQEWLKGLLLDSGRIYEEYYA